MNQYMKATSSKAWKKKKSAPSGQIFQGQKNLALFRGHLLFILGKIQLYSRAIYKSQVNIISSSLTVGTPFKSIWHTSIPGNPCNVQMLTVFLKVSNSMQYVIVPSVSLDWFKGKFTGNHGFYHQIQGFPVKIFP